MQNKRGQEGITIGTLLLIVLGIVVVVVLIIGFTKGFGFIFGKQDVLPLQQMQAIAKSCELSAESIVGGSALAVDYCVQLKSASKGVYVTCDYAPIRSTLKKTITCGSSMNSLIQQQCVDLKPSASNAITIYTGKSNYTVTNVTGCSTVIVA